MHWCALHDLQISAVYIDGSSNRNSDCLSMWDLDIKFQQEFYRLTAGVETKEVQIENTEFIDLYLFVISGDTGFLQNKTLSAQSL